MPKRYTPTSAAADVEAALRILEGRWKLVILFHLFGGKVMRFSDLERAIPNITQKMLGQQLRSLAADFRARCGKTAPQSVSEFCILDRPVISAITNTQEILIPPPARWNPHFKIDDGIRSGFGHRDYTAECQST
jgi:HxlR-like helix-turn-helix protein